MIKDRIEKIIRDEGITSSKFADEIGAQRSSISHILSGRNNPGFEILQNILKRYGNINAEWLMQGIGNMYKSGGTITNTVEKMKQEQLSIETKTNPTPPLHETTEAINTLKNEDFIEKNERTIEKIVVFFSDNSYKEYFSAHQDNH